MRKILILVSCIVSLVSIAVLFPANAAQVTINPNIPGVTNLNPQTGPCTLVFGLYNYALMIGGILAFAA
ncbi:MAG: hypothetical protein Q8P49_01745, partial [Candidatus Liptonbacteria bacterium]|nr:hypothetical protein [Candidatus Liptonbacteria bacterium]